MQAGSHQGLAPLHVALDREKHGRLGDNAEITTVPHFDISPKRLQGGEGEGVQAREGGWM